MSFVERNKVWLLPLLGLGVVGVIVLNLQTFGKPSAPVPPPETASAGTEPQPTPPPPPVMPPSVEPGTSTGSGGEMDLWADLRALEAPMAQLNDLSKLLEAAENPLPESPVVRPELHPELWGRLPALPAFAKPASDAATPPPLPTLDFILRTPHGRWAYFAGRPFTVGQQPDGYHRVLSIEARRVILKGPDGRPHTLTTDVSLPLVVDSEAP